MKIIKQGKSKEEVDRIIKQVRQFECSTCGCVFEADLDEYTIRQCGYNENEYVCECPNCGRLTNKSRCGEDGDT